MIINDMQVGTLFIWNGNLYIITKKYRNISTIKEFPSLVITKKHISKYKDCHVIATRIPHSKKHINKTREKINKFLEDHPELLI